MKLISKVKKRISHLKQRKIDENKFKRDIQKYIALCDDDEPFKYSKEDEYPIITEYRKEAARLDSHYFIQDIWMAKKIIMQNPQIHYDIGSRVDGFLSHLLSAGLKVNMIDIRPLNVEVDGLLFTQGDATDLTNIEEGSVDSLSSLHVIEHFGLGRYGDELDPKGWIKGLKAMQRIVAVGGYFYISFPTGGRNRLFFNAHRVIEYHEVARVLDKMDLIEAAYTSDYKLYEVPVEAFLDFHMSDERACALYIFKKRET